MNRKILATIAAALAVLLLCTPVSAVRRNDDVRKVELNVNTLTVRVNQTRTLWAEITPRDAEDLTLNWTSSNPEIADVDQEGIVTGISPGTCEITVTAHNGKSDTCVVTVPDRVLTGIELDTRNSSRTEAQIDGGELLSAASLRVAVESAVKEAGPGQTAVLTYTNKSTVSTAALRAAAFTAEYEGGAVILHFITPGADGNQGYLTIDPAKAPSTDLDIKLQVYTDSSRTASVAGSVRRNFGSRAVVIQLAQTGTYAMNVEVSAKVDLSGLDTANLKLYRYDSGSDTYVPLTNSGYAITSQGYLRFVTDQGGTIVVTDR